jgi:multiple sugar transport system substrate-binding protein
MAASARRPHAEAARCLACFAGRAAVQGGLWPRHGGQPAHREAWRHLASSNPFYRDTFSSVADAYLRPRCLGWNRFQSSAGDAINHWLAHRFGDARALEARLRQLWIEATESAAMDPCAKGASA